jgi:hypothetical protein
VASTIGVPSVRVIRLFFLGFCHRQAMEQRIFLSFSLILGGTTETFLQFTMPLKAVYYSFIEKKNVFLKTAERLELEKDL